MKIGIAFANTGLLGTAEGANALAEACEACGVDSVWTVEHVVVPADYQSTYPYSRAGRMPGSEDVPIPDPLTWLTWFGAHSKTVRLGTGIVILPQRNPLVLAKAVATLDLLSGGRVALGVGVGWLREEFDALGVPFEGRGLRTDDYIGAMRALWTQDESTYSSASVTFERAKMNPKPVQGSVPIIIGGHTPAAARRAGRLGDGFYLAKPNLLGQLMPELRSAAEAAGRDPETIELITGGFANPDFVAELARQHVTTMAIAPPALTPDDIGPELERVMAKFD